MRGLAKPNDGRRKKATRTAEAKGDKFLTRQVKKKRTLFDCQFT